MLLRDSAFITWQGSGPPAVRCAPAVLTELAELLMRGFQRFPWGGVESGGLLFGTRSEQGEVRIYSHLPLDCEHEHGPVFELSEQDLSGLQRLLAKAIPEQKEKGYILVGWYHSLSSRDLGLSQADRTLHQNNFPEPWQLCMLLRRSKSGPLAVAVYVPDYAGRLQVVSAQQEFGIENFRIRESDLPQAQPEPEPESPPAPADTVAEPAVIASSDPVFVSANPVSSSAVLSSDLLSSEVLSSQVLSSELLSSTPPPGEVSSTAASPSVDLSDAAPSESAPSPEPASPELASPDLTSLDLTSPELPSTDPASGDLTSTDRASIAATSVPAEPAPSPDLGPVLLLSVQAPPAPAAEPTPAVRSVPFQMPAETSMAAAVEPRRWSIPESPESPLEFLGLSRDPFSQTPDPRLFYPSTGHREALAILLHGVRRRSGFSAIIGDAGVGKSLLLECLIDQLKADKVHFAYLFNPRVNPEQFFELLANDLDLNCPALRKSTILIALNEHLVRQCQIGQTTVLIIDNAHKLHPEVLEEIELLGNLENRQGKLLQVVFAGQPTFESRLERPELRGLRQRLLSRAYLLPLNEQRTGEYIASRLSNAGLREQRIFPREVVVEIHLRTGGVPRLINALCSALLHRCSEAEQEVANLPLLEAACGTLDLVKAGVRREDPDAGIEAASA